MFGKNCKLFKYFSRNLLFVERFHPIFRNFHHQLYIQTIDSSSYAKCRKPSVLSILLFSSSFTALESLLISDYTVATFCASDERARAAFVDLRLDVWSNGVKVECHLDPSHPSIFPGRLRMDFKVSISDYILSALQFFSQHWIVSIYLIFNTM